MENIKDFEKFDLNEKYIGKAGKERVRTMLKAAVDKYIKIIDEMSDDADNGFFVKDFAKWYSATQ